MGRLCKARYAIKAAKFPGPITQDSGKGASQSEGGDELLNGEILFTPREAQVLIERWRVHYPRSDHTARLEAAGSQLRRTSASPSP